MDLPIDRSVDNATYPSFAVSTPPGRLQRDARVCTAPSRRAATKYIETRSPEERERGPVAMARVQMEPMNIPLTDDVCPEKAHAVRREVTGRRPRNNPRER